MLKERYQFNILSPQKIEINAPATKNGPKGTSDLNPFFFIDMSIKPIIAPKKKPRNNPVIMFGHPKTRPKNKASLTSPKPIACPFEKNHIKKKNSEDPKAEKIK